MQCAGFTFNRFTLQCSFHSDVATGKVVQDARYNCFYKDMQATA